MTEKASGLQFKRQRAHEMMQQLRAIRFQVGIIAAWGLRRTGLVCLSLDIDLGEFANRPR